MVWILLHYVNREIGFMNLKIVQKLSPFQKFLMIWWSTTVFCVPSAPAVHCWAALQKSYTKVPSPTSYNMWRTAFVSRSWTTCSMEREIESSWAVAQGARDPSWPFSQLHACLSHRGTGEPRSGVLLQSLDLQQEPCLLWASSRALCV